MKWIEVLNDDAIEAITKEMRNPDIVPTRHGYRLSIGSDPEFMIFCGGRQVSPEIKVGGRTYTGYASGISVDEGMITVDPTAGGEISVSKREFLKTPGAHLEGLASILLSVPESFSCPSNIKDIEVRVSPYHKTQARKVGCGGHVHIGMRKRADAFKSFIKSSDFRIKMKDPVVEYLDESHITKIPGTLDPRGVTKSRQIERYDSIDLASIFLSFFAGIPAWLIEPSPERVQRRAYTPYGTFAQYATPGEGTFEFRFPSTWLYSPGVAMAVLGISYVTAYELVELGLTENRELRESKLYEYADVLANLGDDPHLYSDSHDATQAEHGLVPNVEKEYRRAIDGIMEAVRSFYLYPNYADSIERMFSWIERGWTWETSSDILANWIKPSILEEIKQSTPERSALRDENISSLLESLGRA